MTPDILWCLSFPCFVLRNYLNRIFWKTYICWVTIVYAAWIITNGKSVKVRVGWQLSWVSKFNSTSFILINNQSSIVSLSNVSPWQPSGIHWTTCFWLRSEYIQDSHELLPTSPSQSSQYSRPWRWKAT